MAKIGIIRDYKLHKTRFLSRKTTTLASLFNLLMKTKTIGLIVIIITSITACKKSNEPYTPECSGTTPKFSTEVSAIIASECATSGCHDANSKRGPGALVTYAQINNVASSIRAEVVSGSMPRNSTMSVERRNAIVCWIDGGAKND